MERRAEAHTTLGKGSPMDVKEGILQRLDELIAEANRVAGTRVGGYDQIGRRSLPADVDRAAWAAWRVSCLSLIREVAGEHSHYYTQLAEFANSAYFPRFELARSTLQRVRDDFANGHLRDLRELIAAEVFTDFLEMADHLHTSGYHIPAASVAGAVLEDSLRRLHSKRVAVWKGDSSIAKLNDALRKNQVYAKAEWRQVQAWGDIRNDADHGHFDKVNPDHVKLMIQGIRHFLGKHEG